jgi:opacity protein-like surface antigen
MMKHTSLLALAGALLATSSIAQAAPPVAPDGAGWYYDVSAGGLWLQDLSIAGGYHSNFDTGWGANLELGYNLGNGLGLGLDVGYYHADMGTLSGRGTKVDINGDVKIVPILLTVRYDIKLTESFSFNLGAGIGGVYDSAGLSGVGNLNISDSDDSWDLGFQAQAGFSYHISDGTSIGVGYRYLNVGASDLQGHMIQGSLNFRW